MIDIFNRELLFEELHAAAADWRMMAQRVGDDPDNAAAEEAWRFAIESWMMTRDALVQLGATTEECRIHI